MDTEQQPVEQEKPEGGSVYGNVKISFEHFLAKEGWKILSKNSRRGQMLKILHVKTGSTATGTAAKMVIASIMQVANAVSMDVQTINRKCQDARERTANEILGMILDKNRKLAHAGARVNLAEEIRQKYGLEGREAETDWLKVVQEMVRLLREGTDIMANLSSHPAVAHLYTVLRDKNNTIDGLRIILDEVHGWAVCGAITTPEDLMRNLEHIVAITSPEYPATPSPTKFQQGIGMPHADFETEGSE